MPEAQKMENKKRLIDANALKSQFIDYVRTPPHFHYGDWQNMCISGTEIDEVIADAPTVDAVEVVRCKKCRFSKYFEESGTRKCRTQNGMYRTVEDSDFCSYGEREDNEAL